MADGVVGGQRLMVEHVECGGNIALLQSGKQRTGFDDFGAGGVDEQGAGLHMRKVLGGDDAARGVVQRQMDGDDVAGFDELVEIVDRSGTGAFEMLGRHMRIPCGDLHAEGAGDAGHGGADAAQSDDAHATAGELQSIAAGPRPVAGLDVLIELANAADELEQKGEGVLGHGVIAIMFGVADADLQLARLIEIEVAGDAGTAEHDALDVPLPADGAQQIVRNVVAAHQQGVGILQTLGYGRLVGREFLEHTHAGNVVERGELGLDGLDHRVEHGRHHDEGQIGAFALGFVNLGHGLHIRRPAGKASPCGFPSLRPSRATIALPPAPA